MRLPRMERKDRKSTRYRVGSHADSHPRSATLQEGGECPSRHLSLDDILVQVLGGNDLHVLGISYDRSIRTKPDSHP